MWLLWIRTVPYNQIAIYLVVGVLAVATYLPINPIDTIAVPPVWPVCIISWERLPAMPFWKFQKGSLHLLPTHSVSEGSLHFSAARTLHYLTLVH